MSIIVLAVILALWFPVGFFATIYLDRSHRVESINPMVILKDIKRDFWGDGENKNEKALVAGVTLGPITLVPVAFLLILFLYLKPYTGAKGIKV